MRTLVQQGLSRFKKEIFALLQSPRQFDPIRKRLIELKFAPETFFDPADYDLKKWLETGYGRMSCHGESWIRGNDEVALLYTPPRIGIIRNGKFVVEVPIELYVKSDPSAAMIIQMLGPYPERPAKNPTAVTQSGAAIL